MSGASSVSLLIAWWVVWLLCLVGCVRFWFVEFVGGVVLCCCGLWLIAL